jgi:hypothetical protein
MRTTCHSIIDHFPNADARAVKQHAFLEKALRISCRSLEADVAAIVEVFD